MNPKEYLDILSLKNMYQPSTYKLIQNKILRKAEQLEGNQTGQATSGTGGLPVNGWSINGEQTSHEDFVANLIRESFKVHNEHTKLYENDEYKKYGIA